MNRQQEDGRFNKELVRRPTSQQLNKKLLRDPHIQKLRDWIRKHESMVLDYASGRGTCHPLADEGTLRATSNKRQANC